MSLSQSKEASEKLQERFLHCFNVNMNQLNLTQEGNECLGGPVVVTISSEEQCCFG